jgi:hypothetical protein
MPMTMITDMPGGVGTELMLGTAIPRVGGLSQARGGGRIVRWLTHRCCKPL